MAKQIPTNKSNPCPACGDTKGKCRTFADGDNLLCMTVLDGYNTPPGYKFLGLTTNGQWGKLVADNSEEWSADRRAEYELQKADRQARQRQERAEQLANLPSLNDRHQTLSAKPRKLTKAQNADLLRRGLTQGEVDDCLSRGWLWQERGGYGIAGIDPVTGLIVGGQLARDDRDPKYVWGLGGKTNLAETGQNPLAVWVHPNFDPAQLFTINLAEGFLKPLVAAIRHWRTDTQQIWIGAAGGAFQDAALARVLGAFPEPEFFVLWPDAGAVQNSGIGRQYQNLAQLIEARGAALTVAWWGQVEKSSPDCDELDGETIEQLTWEQINKMLESQKIVSIHTGQPVVPVDSLDAEIRKILDRNLPIAQLQAQKIKLRQSSALQDREFNQLWDVVDRDYEAGEESNPDEIRRLLKAKRSSLKLAQVLPGAIAQPLSELANTLNLREEVYLVSALTVVGSVIQNGTTLLLNRRTGYSVTPNLFTAIVAPPSQRKSPVISAIATKPLRKLERKAKEAYQRALAAWEERKLEAKNNGEDFHEQQPAREIFFFNRASGEAILQQAERSPRRGLLNLSDELAGAFKSKNQYRGGRGSDGEDMLSYYDGEGGKTLRVEGVRNDVGTINYGVLGGIQPRVLEKFLGSCEDDNGNWARYIFVHQPIAAATWQEDDGESIDVPELLATHYELVSEYEPTEYRLSPAASAKFGQLYNDYEKRRVNESNPALQAVIGKSAGRVGKVALNLHLLEAAAKSRAVPDLEISVETIERAAMVAEFAIEQIAAIYSDCGSESGQSPVMARIIELSRRKGAVSAREIYQALPSRSDRPNTAKIRQLFTELADQGFGEVLGDGKSVQFRAFSEQAIPEAIPEVIPEPGLTPGEYVEVAPGAPDYGNSLAGQPLLLIRFDLSDDRTQFYATVMDSNGDNHSVWVCHLQRSTYNPIEIQEAS
jgi:hypothetical protein